MLEFNFSERISRRELLEGSRSVIKGIGAALVIKAVGLELLPIPALASTEFEIVDKEFEPAMGRVSYPWGPMNRAREGYTFHDAGGSLDKFGQLIRILKPGSFIDPRGEAERYAEYNRNYDAARGRPGDFNYRGYCTGFGKGAILGPRIEGGIEIAGIYFTQWDRQSTASFVYITAAPLPDFDFGSLEKPMTPRDFGILIYGLRDEGIPFLVNNQDTTGEIWDRPAYEVDITSEVRTADSVTVRGVVKLANFLTSGQSGFKSISIPFAYRVNDNDPEDEGEWLLNGPRFVAGRRLDPDLTKASPQYAVMRDWMDLDVAGLIFGTKRLVF